MIAPVDPATTPPVAPPVSTPAAHSGRTKEELLATISASRLGTWLGCRLKFYFRYVAGISKPITPALHIGSVVHEVLQQWNLARWRRAPLAGEMVRAVFDKAKRIYEKLVTEKTAKGYTPGEDGRPYQQTEKAGQHTGIHCQLLNPIDEDQVGKLSADPAYWMQEKWDGRRRLLHKQDGVR